MSLSDLGVPPTSRALRFVAAAIGAVLFILCLSLADPLRFSEDGAQYLSSTRHLLAGEGFRTSVLYYEQSLFRSLPAPQTAWPAGFPLVASVVSGATGLPPATSMVLVSALAVLGSGLLVAQILRRCDFKPSVAFAAFLCIVLFQFFWRNALQGMADPLGDFFGVASIWAITLFTGRSRTDLAAFALVSILISAALLVRYQYLAWVPSLALIGLAIVRRSDAWRWSLLVVGLLVLLPMAAAFVSLRESGLFDGGLVAGTDRPWRSLATVFEETDSIPRMARLPFFFLTMGGGAFLILVALLTIRRVLIAHPTGFSSVREDLLAVFACMALGSKIYFIYVVALISPHYGLLPRYFYALLPAAVLVLCFALRGSAAFLGRPALGHASLAGTLVLAVIAHTWVFLPGTRRMLETSNAMAVAAVLERHQVEGVSVLSMLRDNPNTGPVLATQSQALSLVISLPTIGIPIAPYQISDWPLPRIEALVRKHGVRYVAVIRLGMMGDGGVLSDLLQSASVPPWLETMVHSPTLILMRVQRPVLTGRGPSGRDCEPPVSRLPSRNDALPTLSSTSARIPRAKGEAHEKAQRMESAGGF